MILVALSVFQRSKFLKGWQCGRTIEMRMSLRDKRATQQRSLHSNLIVTTSVLGPSSCPSDTRKTLPLQVQALTSWLDPERRNLDTVTR